MALREKLLNNLCYYKMGLSIIGVPKKYEKHTGSISLKGIDKNVAYLEISQVH